MAELVIDSIFMALENAKPDWNSMMPEISQEENNINASNSIPTAASSSSTIGYECLICGKTLGNKGSLMTHLKSIHFGQEYPCTHCGKRFPQDSGRLRHEAVEHLG